MTILTSNGVKHRQILQMKNFGLTTQKYCQDFPYLDDIGWYSNYIQTALRFRFPLYYKATAISSFVNLGWNPPFWSKTERHDLV